LVSRLPKIMGIISICRVPPRTSCLGKVNSMDWNQIVNIHSNNRQSYPQQLGIGTKRSSGSSPLTRGTDLMHAIDPPSFFQAGKFYQLFLSTTQGLKTK
jgi:hypothetical protein